MKKYRWLGWLALGLMAITTLGYMDPTCGCMVRP